MDKQRISLDEYRSLVGDSIIDELYSLAQRLHDKRVVFINSTKKGGGVATLLQSIVPYFEDLGIHTEWYDLRGEDSFFTVTKSFHNALQGESHKALTQAIADYEAFFETSFADLNPHIVKRLSQCSSSDIIVIHDPQPLALINQRNLSDESTWIWRCHIDLSSPQEELWKYVQPLIASYDAAIVSKDEFKHGMNIDWHIIPPSIDAFISKNTEVSEKTAERVFDLTGVPRDKPVISQISRLDKWKDPVGVIEVFKRVRKEHDCSLVLVYNGARDDPEGEMMLKRVKRAREGPFEDDIHLVWGDDQDVVKTFQAYSRVVLQKSLKEGFALTVSEAMWKQTPVIGSKVGGIPLQIKHGESGYLVDSYERSDQHSSAQERHYETTARYVLDLITHPEKANLFGRSARERVRENFLVTRHIKQYLELFCSLV